MLVVASGMKISNIERWLQHDDRLKHFIQTEKDTTGSTLSLRKIDAYSRAAFFLEEKPEAGSTTIIPPLIHGLEVIIGGCLEIHKYDTTDQFIAGDRIPVFCFEIRI